ncbi:ester cyclase [Nocardia sp. NPDC004722]
MTERVMTPEEMNEIYTRHAAAEASKDVEGILATLSDEVEHEVVGDPRGILRDHAAIGARYRELVESIDEDKFETVHRYYGENFMVDESHWWGRVPGNFLGIPGNNRQVDFRILHVCEFRDGKMTRENVWLDVAAVMQQLAPAH